MRGVANTLQQQGLDSAALFGEVGLSIKDLDDPDFRWPTEEISRLWTLAAERSGNPDIGLFDPHLPRPDQYGLVGYVMMSSPDLLTGLTRFIRYICLVSDALTATLEPGDGGRWVKLDLFGGECPIPRQRYDYAVLNLLTFCRWMLGRPLTPEAACFAHAVPASTAAYNDAFGSPLQFEAKFNGLLISSKDLASKLPTAIPELADVHDRLAGEALRKLITTDTAHRARQVIARHLHDGSPLRATIAAELNMSDHTLQRRLADEGTAFTDVVEDTRRELAQHYLADRRITIADIAYMLGYSDQSTFFRASHRWFGESPGEYRSRVQEGHQQEIEAARKR
ncbi:AraC family transcriptional regulator [Bradyrhizobium sacchari]|uniref:AraC family transcriptional regulator n=1 Tax=Bradyrhizobium sacchari TaxID=1399419 RepID=A0A560KNE0_9BRAD|nr:AraC family transcriptional regulator [Bradyrhizobium sacchari]OPY95528.1 AraC family transcriptional regulator [Bradyrhizobium sacchari]TWB66337.1 AraC family transcriptional regulator [Bradyrhizobium sacchari]TWB83574.1 AraC family transcriptional regulator [Bradyrhizobium sacchari]